MRRFGDVVTGTWQPSELLAQGIRDYHQVVVKPHRIIHWAGDEAAQILLVVDGRRDMCTLLSQRLPDTRSG